MLPSGASLRVLSPVFRVATKLDAYADRGGGDLLGSRDFADLIALFDGRPELAGEIESSDTQVRSYLAAAIAALLRSTRIEDGVAGALLPDGASQARADLVVLPALRRIAAAL